MTPAARAPRTRSYRASGVDLARRTHAVAALVRAAQYRAPASHGTPVGGAGHFAGLLRLGAVTVAVTTDTVGTKVLLAEELGRWQEVGEDLVGVNVNDLAAVGARAAGLVDTILYGRSSERVFREIGVGLRRGLSHAQCSLLGGETAQVPEIVRGIDLGGTAVGFFPRGRAPILGGAVRPGDVILGIPSIGFHANGYTLIRRVVRERRVRLDRPRPGGRTSVGRELLRPTRVYSGVAEALGGLPSTHGLAHLSGGGVRNLVRLRRGVRFVLDRFPRPPSLFSWLGQVGQLPKREMYQTFNMGVGFAAIVAAGAVDETLDRLEKAGVPDAAPIGHVARGRGVTVPHERLAYSGYA